MAVFEDFSDFDVKDTSSLRTVSRGFVVTEVSSVVDALAETGVPQVGEADPEFAGCLCTSRSLKIWTDETGVEKYKVLATFEDTEVDQPSVPREVLSWSLSVSGESRTIYNRDKNAANQEIAPSTQAPEIRDILGGRLGIDKENIVGADKDFPTLDLRISRRVPFASYSAAQAAAIAVAQTVNDAIFWGFAVGSVKFEGIEVQGRTDTGGNPITTDTLDLTYSFKIAFPYTVKAKLTYGYSGSLYKDVDWELGVPPHSFVFTCQDTLTDDTTPNAEKKSKWLVATPLYARGNFSTLGIPVNPF